MTPMPHGHTTGARLLALVAVFVAAGLGGLAVTGCGDSDSKVEARHADAVRARLAREHSEKLRAEKLRKQRARRARARRAREQQAANCGPGLVRQGGYCVVPQPSGGGQTTTPSDQAPSVDSAEGQQKLKQDPDCQGVPPPPSGYHGPVQC
jgi:hypothetical protein